MARMAEQNHNIREDKNLQYLSFLMEYYKSVKLVDGPVFRP